MSKNNIVLYDNFSDLLQNSKKKPDSLRVVGSFRLRKEVCNRKFLYPTMHRLSSSAAHNRTSTMRTATNMSNNFFIVVYFLYSAKIIQFFINTRVFQKNYLFLIISINRRNIHLHLALDIPIQRFVRKDFEDIHQQVHQFF